MKQQYIEKITSIIAVANLILLKKQDTEINSIPANTRQVIPTI